jgi:predicted nuclease of predicted toxin-antitoxin system
MKLLLDQGTPRRAAAWLRQSGLGVVHTGEEGLSTAADAQILEIAREQDRVGVTLDADFHTMMAISGAASPSVIRVRMEGLTNAPLAALLLNGIGQCQRELNAGALVTVQENRIRLRRLPIFYE